MKLREQISSDMKRAMKAKDKLRISVLRMLLSEMTYAQSAMDARKELSEEEAAKVVSSYHKRLVKALGDFPEGDKKVTLASEIAIVEEYLPARVGRDEIARVIDKLLATADDRHFGTLMKSAMAELGPNVDGRAVSELLREKMGK